VKHYYNIVVRVVAKENGIVNMVWRVGLEISGGVFEPWIEQKV